MSEVNYNKLHYHKEIKIKHESINDNRPIECNIEVNDLDGNTDCKIGHFGYNFWFRTPYGLKGLKYKSCKRLERAIEKVLKNNGFEILCWV